MNRSKERCATNDKRGRKRKASEEEDPLSGPDTEGGSSSEEEDASEGEGMESGTTSDSTSSDSTSGSDSSSSSSSSGSSSNNEAMDSLFREDEFGRYLEVSCAKNEAKLYMKRFSRGSRGKCILFKDRWVTPNEFQAISGRKSSKDWKRSIRLHGRCLKEFIVQGLFQEHPRDCPCAACVGGDSELLRQEGALALAAKKRRLSQADNLSTTEPNFTGSTQLGTIDNESKSPANLSTKQRGRPKKNPAPIKSESPHPTPDVSRIWSPSGETGPAADGSSNEEEYHPSSGVDHNTQSLPHGVLDSSDFLPRRSHRKRSSTQSYHRTELGTFKHKPSEWDVEEVAEFLHIQGFGNYADQFQENDLNGSSLFLLKESHLLDQFHMKLGPALRLLDIVSRLRQPPHP